MTESTVTTQKRINLDLLDQSIGNVGLRAVGELTTTARKDITAPVDAATLQAAVDAHVYVDRDANAATLRQQAATALAGNRTFLAIASPTNAQIAAQVKALTRQNQALIRLAVGSLDAVD